MTRTQCLSLTLCLSLFLSLLFPQKAAHAESFQSWLVHFKTRAVHAGISAETLNSAFQGVTPHQRVIELDGKQPERTKMGFETYLHRVMSQKRIDQGRTNYARNIYQLKKIEHKYGVPATIITSLWGIETSYGANTGGFDLVQALATLAWEGRRRTFFEKELINALKILQDKHIDRADFKGSWAGAMGQNQFMPSSWKRYAVDENGDGHKDIWTTKADIFASSANYLKQNGWNNAYPWGWQVDLPKTLPSSWKNSDQYRPLVSWLKKGVHIHGGIPNGQSNTKVRLIVPDGGKGRAYLVTKNFDVILSWNRSTYFALTVGILSDFIGQTPSSHLNN